MQDIRQRGLLEPIAVYQKNSKYILIYGNRRVLACKKLGWTKIPAIIKAKELDLNNFLAENIAENIHRENISPIEEGRIYLAWNEEGMSIGEIAARANIPKIRVQKAITLFRRVPKKFRGTIANISPRMRRKGADIPVTSVDNIFKIVQRSRLGEEKLLELLEVTKKEAFSSRTLKLIGELIQKGMTVKEAIIEKDKYKIKTCELLFNKGEWAKLKLKSTQAFVEDCITAKNKKLLMRTK